MSNSCSTTLQEQLAEIVESLQHCLTVLQQTNLQQTHSESQISSHSIPLVKTLAALQANLHTLSETQVSSYSPDHAFREAIERSILAGVLAVDRTGRQTYANATFCHMVGWSAAELVGATPPFAYWATEELEQTTQTFQAILNSDSDRSFTIELPFCRRNGDRFQALLSIAPLLGANRTVEGWVASVYDLTEHKRIQAALRRSETRLERLVANIPGMVYRYLPCENAPDLFTYVNSGSRELFELEPATVLEDANSVWALIHPDDRQSLRDSVETSAQNSMPWQWEGRIITPSGQIKWVQGNSRPEITSDGEVWDGLLIDITERKQAEAALRESEERFRQIAENIREVFFINSVDVTRILYVSPTYQEMWGQSCPIPCPQARPWLEAVHPDDQPQVQAALERQAVGAAFQEEYRIIKSDGSIQWIFDRTFPIYNDAGLICRHVGVAEDITERKQAEAQLKASLKEKEVLLKEIHHRVKNNLQIISSLLLLQSNRVTDPQMREILFQSQNRISSMALVHESLYRSDNFAQINFANYVNQLATNLFHSHQKPSDLVCLNLRINPHITLSLEEAIPCSLLFNELMTNALKHGFAEGESGQVYVDLTQDKTGEITLAVGNDGDRLPLNFDLQAVSSLGLKLVLTLIRQLRGAIELERGDRTIFRVKFLTQQQH